MAGQEMEASSSVKPSRLLKPEHRIFLSHSGDEKSFVEQLWVDLHRVNQPAFFDQDRNSLPLGENFVPFIRKAAEQCSLAVVVLSKGYLSSKWPMLELSAFLKAKKTTNPNLKLFPLFYKLSPGDLDAKKVETEWVEIWKQLVEDGRVRAEEISSWTEAVEFLRAAKNEELEKGKALTEQLTQGEIEAEEFPKLLSEVVRELRPFNGMDFRKYGGSEVKYRAGVVDEICRCVPPMMEYGTEKIRGYHRLCEMISSMFEEVSEEWRYSTGKDGPLYLGLYGMGGVGKTTLCEAMCSYFQQEFGGRVCHVELQTDSRKGQIERVKRAVQQLAGFDNRVLEIINTFSQGIDSLENRLRVLPPVFLAVDNVGDSQSSRDEAKAYLNAGLACGSKVLVTSRSRMILNSILEEKAKCCKPIPRLKGIEAAEVFLSVSAPGKSFSSLQCDEQEIVQACLRKCQFNDDGYRTQQFHPLVLRALGAYFHDIDEDHNIMRWGAALGELEGMLRMSRESKQVNDILGLSYKTLDDMGKKIFLDVAYLAFVFRTSRDYIRSARMYEWELYLIARFRGISEFEAGMKVKELQRKSLVNESFSLLTMHDLYHEFVLTLMKEDGKEIGWWMVDAEPSFLMPEMVNYWAFTHVSSNPILNDDPNYLDFQFEVLWWTAHWFSRSNGFYGL